MYSIFHLLKGKKSAQTIQDAHLFSLTELFHTYSTLDRRQLEITIGKLLNENLIKENFGQRYFLTDKGTGCLRLALESTPLPLHLNGLKYHQSGQKVWERLSLLVQVCSYFSREDSSYVPIQKNRDTQKWLKSFIRNMDQQERANLPGRLLNELISLLEEERNVIPEVLVLRLSGYRSAGMTPHQAAIELDMDVFHYHLEFMGTLHYLCKISSKQRDKYPLLSLLDEETGEGRSLTHSAKQTFKFLKEGLNVASIAAVRDLKVNTVEDHIVEIALNIKNFSIDPFVSIEEQKKIIDLASRTATKQLRILKEQAGETSYFKIRLVLAKLGDQSC
ncbi:helix-turn-helix domain-containing protein [Neobacillus notoginsengisoli]|nr:helix-turn-helix domain-containing protein [Neobacillus notoginsengisoli]